MRRHINPHRVNDPSDIFEVGENSSHPELDDARRIWKFGAYTFNSATEVAKFFEQEGLNPRQYDMRPKSVREFSKNLIIIQIVPKTALPRRTSERSLREA